jgi:predicted O-methyltransferase YrrM
MNESILFRKGSKRYDANFDYYNYQREMINDKIKEKAGYENNNNHPYLLNGIIRKLKPKNCLEIGTARGGSSIVILNAIKDIKDSILISLDIDKKWYKNRTFEVGYRVKKYFPELANKWKLYTGKQPHQFLVTLNMKFDLLYLDTVHSTPGELINIIEALPFLNDNAIVILHDVMFHYLIKSHYKFHPSNIYLFSTLCGDKVIVKDEYSGIENTGAIFLYKNQEKCYLNYFLLLLSPWNYVPSKEHKEELELFIKKYYKDEIYLYLFNQAVYFNQMYINNLTPIK